MKKLGLSLLVIGFMFLGCSTLGRRETSITNSDKATERVGYGDLTAFYSGDVHSSHKKESKEYRKQVDFLYEK